MFLLGFILYGTLHFLDLGECFLSHIRKIFCYFLFKYFLRPLLSPFSFWDPYNANAGAVKVVPEVSNCPHVFFFFSFICSVTVIFTILSSSSLIHSSASFILLILLVYFSFQLLYCSTHFFMSSRSLLNIFCIFLSCTSILFLRSRIIFSIIPLNFRGVDCLSPPHLVVLRFHLVPSSGTYSSPTSFCLTFCVCSFHSAGCRAVCSFASSVSPLADEAGIRYLSRLPGGRACFLPTSRQGHVKGCV